MRLIDPKVQHANRARVLADGAVRQAQKDRRERELEDADRVGRLRDAERWRRDKQRAVAKRATQ